MDHEQSAADVFGLLSNDIRVDILRAMAIAQAEELDVGGGIGALSFSEIYERIDVDNTSKLSYHLGELTGTFLRKHESGYSFTYAGDQLVRFILAENYREPGEFDPIETAGSCLFCGESDLEAVQNEQFFVIRCASCDRLATGYILTPAQARSHEGSALIDSFKRKQATEFGSVQHGICAACSGQLESWILDVSETRLSDSVPISFLAIHRCEECLRGYSGPLCYSVAYRPAGIALHWDHGIDITGTGMWELHQHLLDGSWTAEQISDDPPRYRVVLEMGAEELRVELDEQARFTKSERVRAQSL